MGDIARGRFVQDKNDFGGLHRVFIAKLDETEQEWGGTLAFDSTNTDEVTDIINGGSATSETATLYQFDLQGNSTFEEVENESRENGTVFYEQTGQLNFKKFGATDAFDTYQLATSRWFAFYEYKNGVIRFSGYKFGLEKGGNNGSGATLEDGTKFSYTFKGMEPKPAYFVDRAAIYGTGGTPVTGLTITKGPTA